jgi:hypothetical protein
VFFNGRFGFKTVGLGPVAAFLRQSR